MRGSRRADLADDGMVVICVLEHVQHLVLDGHRLVDASHLSVLVGEACLHVKPLEGPPYRTKGPP